MTYIQYTAKAYGMHSFCDSTEPQNNALINLCLIHENVMHH